MIQDIINKRKQAIGELESLLYERLDSKTVAKRKKEIDVDIEVLRLTIDTLGMEIDTYEMQGDLFKISNELKDIRDEIRKIKEEIHS